MNRANISYHIQNQIADNYGIVAGRILEREVNVTSAELLALATTPKELVPAPGTDKTLEFIRAIIKYNYGSTTYTESSDDMVIEYSDSGGRDVTASIDSTGFIDQTNDEIRLIPHDLTAMPITIDLEALKNKSLQLSIPNDDPTLGNGTLDIRISYRIHDFS